MGTRPGSPNGQVIFLPIVNDDDFIGVFVDPAREVVAAFPLHCIAGIVAQVKEKALLIQRGAFEILNKAVFTPAFQIVNIPAYSLFQSIKAFIFILNLPDTAIKKFLDKPERLCHAIYMSKSGSLGPCGFVLQKYPCGFIMDTPLIEFSRRDKSLLSDQIMQSCGIDRMFRKNKDLIQR